MITYEIEHPEEGIIDESTTKENILIDYKRHKDLLDVCNFHGWDEENNPVHTVTMDHFLEDK